jgi:DHA2 family multidrug resistance protein
MLDRGEDADWLQSSLICALAVLSIVGLVGGVAWLLYTDKPIVNLRVLADRNFAVGCLSISAMSFVLYSSSVLLPQLAQQQLGYTATWAGLILTPGAIALIFLILLMGRVMPLVQTRYIIAFGFFFLGCSLIYSCRLTPTIDFASLTQMRILQTAGLGFLFVPISSIAFSTVPRSLNADAAALFTMFRNVVGSVGISVATAMVTTRSQVRMAYLTDRLTPFNQPFADALNQMSLALQSLGSPVSMANRAALGRLYQTLISQAHILAYIDVFMFCAALSFVTVPFVFLLSPTKAGRESGRH